MRHEACVICGGWVVFLATFALTALFSPVRGVVVPALFGVTSAFFATPAIHTGLRARDVPSNTSG